MTNGSLWVEAIAVSRGSGADAVPEIDYGLDTQAMFVPDERLLLRISHAIETKCKKYLSYRKAGHVKERSRVDLKIRPSTSMALALTGSERHAELEERRSQIHLPPDGMEVIGGSFGAIVVEERFAPREQISGICCGFRVIPSRSINPIAKRTDVKKIAHG
jgi:hypothetical protein